MIIIHLTFVQTHNLICVSLTERLCYVKYKIKEKKQKTVANMKEERIHYIIYKKNSSKTYLVSLYQQ